ncbi:hypothetical protein FHP25_15525 [Vineibacter terrae]|uniref:SGNH hydrolase-type esterase domain-containing protein n=1 Tax=Vineibacter terrae TaxID=2586908 RepID=A0A5C8PM54_9HYPH|nr:hypothetical protein [Vineibacter terrae]TXL74822.1 hypothetical protein FHP25_15525 [Vineibacter terrae]
MKAHTRSRRSRLTQASIGTAMVLASLTVALLAAEFAVRLLGSGERRWEFGNFIENPRLLARGWRTMQHDTGLGYVPRPGYSEVDSESGKVLTFDENGLRAHRRLHSESLDETSPVLAVGDSYAMGEQAADDETWPVYLEGMIDRRVLNGGVSGYGIDQAVLRAERLVPIVRPGVLLVSFIADDVNRARMRILWGVDKPYFDIERGTLVLRNVPVKLPRVDARLDPVRRVLGYSFLVDAVMRRLKLTAYWSYDQPSYFEPAHDQGERVACLLMDRLRRLGETYGMQVLVVAQYTPNAWLQAPAFQHEVQVAENLLACARANQLQTLDTRPGLEAAVRTDGVWRYYFSGHMNDAGNRLTATMIAHQLGW